MPESTSTATEAAPPVTAGAASLLSTPGGTGTPAPGASSAGDGGRAPPPAEGWLTGMSDEQRRFVAENGWQQPSDLVANMRETQRFLGADKAGRGVVIPPDDNPEAWAEVYTKLGRPEAPEGYGIATQEGADPAFAGSAQQAFYEAGLSKSQAEKLTGWWNQQSQQLQQADTEQFAKQSQTEYHRLEQEWGAEAPAKTDLARRAVADIGFTPDELNAMERALGTRGLMERMARVGQRLTEDRLPRDVSQDTSSPGGAAAEIERLLGDREFTAKMHAKDQRAIQRLEQLHKAAYPEPR